VKLNLPIIVILVRIKQAKMDFIVYASVAAIRKNEVGQKWIIVLKEKYAHSVGKKKI